MFINIHFFVCYTTVQENIWCEIPFTFNKKTISWCFFPLYFIINSLLQDSRKIGITQATHAIITNLVSQNVILLI